MGSASQSPFESKAIEALKKSGCRITSPRVQVIRTLAEADRALSANTIHERISASGGKIDMVSVYRTLTTLVGMHVVHHVGVVDGYLACGVEEHQGPLCEHLVCQDCGKVTEMEVDEAVAASTALALAKRGFSAREVKIEVLGVCADCQS